MIGASPRNRNEFFSLLYGSLINRRYFIPFAISFSVLPLSDNRIVFSIPLPRPLLLPSTYRPMKTIVAIPFHDTRNYCTQFFHHRGQASGGLIFARANRRNTALKRRSGNSVSSRFRPDVRARISPSPFDFQIVRKWNPFATRGLTLVLHSNWKVTKEEEEEGSLFH